MKIESLLIKKWKLAYCTHRKDARDRGISFDLSFDQWLEIWIRSGHFFERGHKKGQFVMGRFGDIGPYSPENVKIILHSENVVEGLLGRAKSESHKQAMRKPKSQEHRDKIAQANRKRAKDPEFVARKPEIARKGWISRRSGRTP